MTTASAVRPPVATRRPPPAPSPRGRRASPGLVAVRVLTVLVGLATAVVTLGPRAVVVDGRAATETWLTLHPSTAALVESLGGVEAAGNLMLFVPFAALLALSMRLRLLPVAFVVLLCAPPAVEWAQAFLPGRVPDGADVVRNTIGLLAAFTFVALLRVTAAGAARILRGAVR